MKGFVKVAWMACLVAATVSCAPPGVGLGSPNGKHDVADLEQKLRVGMTEQEVTSIAGEPNMKAAAFGDESAIYYFDKTTDESLLVAFKDGRVAQLKVK